MKNFLIQRAIPAWGKNTFVNWSLQSQNKAIIFIHGFNGSSTETFGDFNLDFRYRPEYAGYDVYFFGYNSLFAQIANSALDFLEFLRALHDDINSVINESKANVIRPGHYSKMILIAHSLGAVVARQGLNDGYDNNENWLDKCELILFAPAHIGARTEIDSFINFPGPLKALGPLARYFVVTLNQLLAPGIIINPMTEKCKELIAVKGIKTFTIAKKVLWAERERVVINRKFLNDPNALRIPGNHEKICKPSKNFERPFDEVRTLL